MREDSHLYHTLCTVYTEFGHNMAAAWPWSPWTSPFSNLTLPLLMVPSSPACLTASGAAITCSWGRTRSTLPRPNSALLLSTFVSSRACLSATGFAASCGWSTPALCCETLPSTCSPTSLAAASATTSFWAAAAAAAAAGSCCGSFLIATGCPAPQRPNRYIS